MKRGISMETRGNEAKKKLNRLFFLLILITVFCLSFSLADDLPCEWNGIKKIIAIGDLHGDYDNFVEILKGVKLVDESLHWIGGEIHLVQTGDILDRGPDARKIFDLIMALEKEADKAGGMVHMGGTFITIEGPRFSTRGESKVYRSWGMDIIGMTAVPEAQLAREAEICYATMAHVTDYDVWHEEEEAVNVEMLIANLMANAALSKETIAELVPLLPEERCCDCGSTLSAAIITQRDLIPRTKIEQLGPLVAGYLG